MEESTFRRAILSALYSMALGAILALLTVVGIAADETFTLAAVAGLTGVALLTSVCIQLWVSMCGEKVAYRVLYHAEEQPDGIAVGRLLGALARSAGHMSIIWRFHFLTEEEQATRAAIIRTMPAAAASDRISQQVDPGGQEAPSEGSNMPLIASISLYIVAPSAGQEALEGMLSSLLPGVWAEKCAPPKPLRPSDSDRKVRAWRWPTPAGEGSDTGTPSDPFACAMHINIRRLATSIAAHVGLPMEVGEAEVRLKLWPQGRSAVVAARCTIAQEPAHSPSGSTNQIPASGELPERSCEPAILVLKPLLWGSSGKPAGAWPRFGLRRPDCVGGQAPRGQTIAPSRDQKGAFSQSSAGLRNALFQVLIADYPLWERFNAAPCRCRNKGRKPKAEVADGSIGIIAVEPGRSPGVTTLFFPSTTGLFSSLDSIKACEVPPPPAYRLPAVPSQVLVLGRATQDGRVIGVPALRSLSDASPGGSRSERTPAGSGLSAEAGSPAAKFHRRMELHPMLAEHLLVAGGSDSWRRDVAGSLVSQALETGMTVVAVDGGSPTDELPASARKRSRIVSTDIKRSASAISSATLPCADPLSPADTRLNDPALRAKRVAQVDMDNPGGSVRPNLLYVPAPSWLPPVQGEALALHLALQIGLPGQVRYLQAVNVTGMDASIMDAGVSGAGLPQVGHGGPGLAIVEAWITLLLLRHHRARLLLASRCIPSPLEKATTRDAAMGAGSALPSCPDLPALMLVLEQSETLLSLLRRERAAWGDRAWVSLLRDKGSTEGEQVLRTAGEALERAAQIEGVKAGDLFLYGAALRGQIGRVLGHPGMIRMLSGPHVSLSDILQDGAVRMLRVNLSGAYRTASMPYTEDDLARKHYGLYLLWSLWALSRQRIALNEHASARNQGCWTTYAQPNPVLLMLHGAGAWFGSGSPLAESSMLDGPECQRSGIAVAATVSGLRHLRAYHSAACARFGSLVLGPAPIADLDASEATLNVVEAEMRLLSEGIRSIAAGDPSLAFGYSRSPAEQEWQAPNAERLLEVLRRMEEGTCLVVTNMPCGRKVVCTARVSSAVASDVRSLWLSPSLPAPDIASRVASITSEVPEEPEEPERPGYSLSAAASPPYRKI